MRVRPIYWYILAGVLVMALLLGAGENLQEIRQLKQGVAGLSGQENSPGAEKTDTALFLAELADQAEDLTTELVLFTTENLLEADGLHGQITATGAYNDLAELLSWLESQSGVYQIEQFVLKEDQSSAMQLVVDVVFM